MKRITWLLPLILLAGCAVAQPPPTPTGSAIKIELSSPVFKQGASIPKQYTCSGDQVSPPLQWSGIPAGAKSLALILDDPDAPAGTWVHWVVYNLPLDLAGLPEGVSKPKSPPVAPLTALMQGRNSWGRNDYGGPCPPSGQHRYFFHLYALDAMLDVKSPDKAGLLSAMQGHILGAGELMGVYQK